MTTTNHLSLTLVEQSQSQKEITVNQALATLDALLNTGAKDKDLATPPGSPAEGDVYIVAASPTGAWTSHAKHIAYYANAAWNFIVPNEGLTLWVNDEDTLYSYNGTSWASQTENLAMLGINATADTTNRLSVNSDAVLLNHNGTSVQVKVNKNASGNTASHIFQTSFSERAEFGCIGDDNFQLKVSPDGSSFFQSFVIDKSTGNADFKQVASFEQYITLHSGITAPSTTSGQAKLYIDTADGDLKVIFPNGTVRTIATD